MSFIIYLFILKKSTVSFRCLFTGFLIVGSCILTALEPSILIKAVWILAAILVLIVSFVIWKQPESKTKLSFKVSALGGGAARKEPSGRWLAEDTSPSCHIFSALLPRQLASCSQ